MKTETEMNRSMSDLATIFGISFPMAEIPPGTIALRDDRKGTKWSVELRNYAIGVHPITQAQYSAVTGIELVSPEDAYCPVTNVSWIDAVRFCNLLSGSVGKRQCYEIDAKGENATLVADGDEAAPELPGHGPPLR